MHTTKYIFRLSVNGSNARTPFNTDDSFLICIEAKKALFVVSM